jgi:predicted transposase/invertase (TIGR01784 family)
MKLKIENLLRDNSIETSDAQEMLRKIFSGKKVGSDEKARIDWFIQLLESNGISAQAIGELLLPFADPTFDTTFKMLFGSKEHDNILISLLNNLLDFTGDKEIKELEIITEKLESPIFSYEDGRSSVTGAVDVLCTTTSNQKIAIEMQRAKQPYFLARTQHYMSKLISVQVNEKGGKEYHRDILDTYILVLEKQNLFTGQHKLSDNSLYEIEVEPIVKQTGQVFPGNKMHWKFFELSKFKEHEVYRNLTKDSSLKHQWLEFLINCGDQLNEPERDDIIKQGYKIMKLAQWSGDKQNLYWLEQAREFDQIENQKELIQEAEKKGLVRGKLESDIDKIKIGIEEGWNQTKILSKLTLLSRKHWLEKEWSQEQSHKVKRQKVENIQSTDDQQKEMLSKFEQLYDYVQQHQSDTQNQICNDLELLGDLDVLTTDT